MFTENTLCLLVTGIPESLEYAKSMSQLTRTCFEYLWNDAKDIGSLGDRS